MPPGVACAEDEGDVDSVIGIAESGVGDVFYVQAENDGLFGTGADVGAEVHLRGEVDDAGVGLREVVEGEEQSAA